MSVEDPSIGSPQFWGCNNDVATPNFVRSSSLATEGSKSCKLAVLSIEGVSNFGGMIYQGFPISNIPESFSFKYQLNRGSGTTPSILYFAISVTSFSTGEEVIVGYGDGTIIENTNGWQTFSGNILPAVLGVPDSIFATFQLNAGDDTTAYFLIDDINFSTTPSGINHAEANNITLTYLSAESALEIRTTKSIEQCLSVELCNIIGEKTPVKAEKLTSNELRIKMDGLAKGIYFVKGNADGERFLKKLVIE